MDDKSETKMNFMIKLVIKNFDSFSILWKFIANCITTCNSLRK